jgi:hypothetical protein
MVRFPNAANASMRIYSYSGITHRPYSRADVAQNAAKVSGTTQAWYQTERWSIRPSDQPLGTSQQFLLFCI